MTKKELLTRFEKVISKIECEKMVTCSFDTEQHNVTLTGEDVNVLRSAKEMIEESLKPKKGEEYSFIDFTLDGEPEVLTDQWLDEDEDRQMLKHNNVLKKETAEKVCEEIKEILRKASEGEVW